MPWDDELERLMLPDDGVIAAAIGTVIPMDAYYEALRTELRRLARPN